jgi:glutamate dehydrogenase/leucine dehydrogenase
VQRYYWTEDGVNTKLKDKMLESFEDCLEYMEKYKVNMRKAAYILAIERVADAVKVRGIFP